MSGVGVVEFPYRVVAPFQVCHWLPGWLVRGFPFDVVLLSAVLCFAVVQYFLECPFYPWSVVGSVCPGEDSALVGADVLGCLFLSFYPVTSSWSHKAYVEGVKDFHVLR